MTGRINRPTPERRTAVAIGATFLCSILLSSALVAATPAGVFVAQSSEKKPKKKSSKKRSKKTAKKEDYGPWVLPSPGYSKKLERAIVQVDGTGSLEYSVAIIPDAYVYFMAKDLEAMERAAFSQAQLDKKIPALHRKHKGHRGRLIFKVNIKGSGANTYFFIDPKIKNYFELRAGPKKTFTIKIDRGKPKFRKWQIYEHPPGRPRKIYHRTLGRFSRLECTLVTGSLKKTIAKNEPFTLNLKNFIQLQHTGGPQSVNTSTYQLSCFEWRQVVSPEVRMKFYPGRWKKRLPKMDSRLARILKRLR